MNKNYPYYIYRSVKYTLVVLKQISYKLEHNYLNFIEAWSRSFGN